MRQRVERNSFWLSQSRIARWCHESIRKRRIQERKGRKEKYIFVCFKRNSRCKRYQFSTVSL